MLYFIFINIIIKINHLYLFSISLLHNLKAPHGYGLILSKVCNLLSLLILSAILLTSSVYTQCASFSNLSFAFSMVSFLNKQFL